MLGGDFLLIVNALFLTGAGRLLLPRFIGG
jgi:hypothetical protein